MFRSKISFELTSIQEVRFDQDSFFFAYGCLLQNCLLKRPTFLHWTAFIPLSIIIDQGGVASRALAQWEEAWPAGRSSHHRWPQTQPRPPRAEPQAVGAWAALASSEHCWSQNTYGALGQGGNLSLIDGARAAFVLLRVTVPVFVFLAMSSSMQHLSSPTRDQTHAPALGTWRLNHWPARGFHNNQTLIRKLKNDSLLPWLRQRFLKHKKHE